jgi:hypothetical protein
MSLAAEAGPVYIIHSFIHTFIAQDPVFMAVHYLTAEIVECDIVTLRPTTRVREEAKRRMVNPDVKE